MASEQKGERLEVEFGLSRMLRDSFKSRKDSTGEILQELLQAARLYLGMEVAFISEFREGHRYFRYVDQAQGTEMIKVGGGDPLDESYCKKVVEGRLPELIQDAQQIPEACKLSVTREAGIGAHLSTPIYLKNGSVYGTFCSFSFQAEHTLNERDLALMRLFSDMASKLIQEDVDQAREEAEKRFRIESLLGGHGHAMVWQPIMDMETGEMLGVESLSRFADSTRSPSDWFDEALEVGLSSQLESRAIRKGLEVLAHLPDSACVTVNAASLVVTNGEIDHILAQLPLERIVLEITEHEAVADYEALSQALRPFRDKGLRIAVDDAGAGYANFRHILLLQPDIIKLDMSLTRDIDSDVTKRSLAAALKWFSREIGASLIAEGVETRTERDALVQLGISRAQGFYMHRPMDLEKLERIFKTG